MSKFLEMEILALIRLAIKNGFGDSREVRDIEHRLEKIRYHRRVMTERAPANLNVCLSDPSRGCF